jgi:hypothetical protein
MQTTSEGSGMKESCSCGAAIQTISYKRAITWRLTHFHQTETEQVELESETSVIGFTPNIEADEDEEEC